jgi:hypothetical protein
MPSFRKAEAAAADGEHADDAESAAAAAVAESATEVIIATAKFPCPLTAPARFVLEHR